MRAGGVEAQRGAPRRTAARECRGMGRGVGLKPDLQEQAGRRRRARERRAPPRELLRIGRRPVGRATGWTVHGRAAPADRTDPMTALRVIAIDDEPLALRRLEWCLQDVARRRAGRQDRRPAARPRADPHARTRRRAARRRDARAQRLRADRFTRALGTLGDGPLPEIVFVTAFDHFAVKAFAVSVVDYLLKPVERSRLVEALERARVVASCATHRPAFRSCARSSTACAPTAAAAARRRNTKPSCGSAKATRACACLWR